jgi:hypothetical protein
LRLKIEYIDRQHLPAPTVTKANVDDPTLWANGAKN